MAKAVGHGRKLWVHRGARPGDPPYGDIDAMERWKVSQAKENDRLATQREKMRAISGSEVAYRMEHGGLDGMDLSGLDIVENCPMCFSVMTTSDGDLFTCSNRKCRHEMSA